MFKVDKDDKQLGELNEQELQNNALRSFVINNLEVGSKYLVTITATNKVGPSAAETLFVTIPSEGESLKLYLFRIAKLLSLKINKTRL